MDPGYFWNLNNYIDELTKYSLLDPIDLLDYGVMDLNDSFINKVHDFPKPQNINIKNSILLFREKFALNSKLPKNLVEMGLAKKKNIRGDYLVETKTAYSYMGYLANKIGENKDIEATPMTDINPNLNLKNYQKIPLKNHEKIRYSILNDVLPTPYKPVNPESLSNFKDKYSDQLINFRSQIENQIEHFISIPDIENQNDSIIRFKREIKGEIEDLSEKMESCGWGKIIKGNLMTIIPSGLGLASYLISGEPFAAALSGIAIARDSISLHGKLKKEKKRLMDNYCSYPVLANKEF